MKALSLFANIGVAEAYLDEIGVHVCVANEFVPSRADLYHGIYPHTDMICGDITDTLTFATILRRSFDANVDLVIATPPCQGMSTAGQQNENDERNQLILPTIAAIKILKPRYVFLENVPMFYQTEIPYKEGRILIPDLITQELGEYYSINFNILDTANFGVPQTRERAITLMSLREANVPVWTAPAPDNRQSTLEDAIGHLPPLDPFVKDVSEEELLRMFPHYNERRDAARRISPWHVPPEHVRRQVVAMQHTPTGCTAFDNPVYFPIKEDGTPVRGYRNTYKRQNWNTPAYTITMDNRKISSQNNVHPGRPEYVDANGDQIYSDPRTLTTYELMLATSLPADWPVPADTSDAQLRRLIGEGIPPLFVRRIFEQIPEEVRAND